VRDMKMGITTRISVASNGTQGNNNSDSPQLTADGRYAVFESDATNLVSGDTNGQTDVFLHDLKTGKTTRVSLSASGGQLNDFSWVGLSSISADGYVIAFHTDSINVVPGIGVSNPGHVYVRDLTPPISLSKSTVSVSTSQLASGSTATVTLVARDANGNEEFGGNLAVTFGLGSGTACGSFGPITNNGKGTYMVAFTATTAGTNTITATIRGAAVTSKPPTVKVVPGEASPVQSTVTALPSSITAGGKVTVTLTMREANGNQELGGGLVVAFELAAGSAGGTFGPVTDHKNGTYTATVTVAAGKSGNDTIVATIGGNALSTSATLKIISPAKSRFAFALPLFAAASNGNCTSSLLADDGESVRVHEAALLAILESKC